LRTKTERLSGLEAGGGIEINLKVQNNKTDLLDLC
jgi:hypothetical protein